MLPVLQINVLPPSIAVMPVFVCLQCVTIMNGLPDTFAVVTFHGAPVLHGSLNDDSLA